MLLSPAIRFVGGKGGVGKTTVAAATALRLAGSGRRTLLASTDPAHSAGDALEAALGDEPVEVTPGLWACEIDAEAAARAHIAAIRADAEATMDRDMARAVGRHLELSAQAPGTVESALLDRVVHLMGQVPGRWDRLVLDTAPTGHTLRLLALPGLVSAWVDGLVRHRERAAGTERMLRGLVGRDDPPTDPLLTRLRARRDRLDAARTRLRADAVVDLVCTLERLPVAETVRTAATLADAHLRVGVIVVNRVLPADDPSPFLAARRDVQRRRLADLTSAQGQVQRIHLAERPGEVVGLDALAAVGHELAAAGHLAEEDLDA